MRRFFVLTALLVLSACKDVLYSDLDEREANQMIAILEAAEISASRSANGEGRFSITVESAKFGAAVLVLQNEGLPKKRYDSLGNMFADDGIVGTPLEERARFTHALNQELAQTVASIAGVHDARVHVVLPETSRYNRTTDPASAAVVIYHMAEFQAHTIVPAVKVLVSHSVANLAYENVSVSLFDAGGAQLTSVPRPAPNTAMAAIPISSAQITIPTQRSDVRHLGILAALSIALALCAVQLRNHFRNRKHGGH